ncbi:hypothetical protein WA158_006740 [Blastocystis sp. Blastoise]
MSVRCPNCGLEMAVPNGCNQFQCPQCRTVLTLSTQAQATPQASNNIYSSQYRQTTNSIYSTQASQEPNAYGLFSAVDTDHNGTLDGRELQSALSSGGLRFNMSTVFLLLSKYDFNHDNMINFQEFQQLISEVWQWKKTYDYFDSDHSGAIDENEFKTALRQVGYNFPDNVVHTIFNSSDSDRSGTMEFDEFIQIMCEIQLVSYTFQQYDTQHRGVINVDLTQLTDIIFSCRR